MKKKLSNDFGGDDSDEVAFVYQEDDIYSSGQDLIKSFARPMSIKIKVHMPQTQQTQPSRNTVL